MAMVGRFGSLRFSVSSDRVLTFNNLKITRGMKTTEHDVPWYKGRLEVTGEDLDSATLDICLRADLGVSPKKQAENIRQLMHQKTANYLVVGGHKLMDRRCIITDMSETWNYVYRNGKVYEIQISLTFKEYN